MQYPFSVITSTGMRRALLASYISTRATVLTFLLFRTASLADQSAHAVKHLFAPFPFHLFGKTLKRHSDNLSVMKVLNVLLFRSVQPEIVNEIDVVFCELRRVHTYVEFVKVAVRVNDVKADLMPGLVL